jgi:2-oxoglutarate/2-oxoacid ferredoxin oxidoreductase subunit beta
VSLRADGSLQLVDVAAVGEGALLVHDPARVDAALAFGLAELADAPTGPTPIGIFRDIQRPVYGRTSTISPEPATEEQLSELLLAGETWTIA